MLRAAIIDNEASSIRELQSEIQVHCPEVEITGTWTNVSDGIKGLRRSQPDVVFLDVELDNDETGFDLIEKMPDRNFEVIFVTAYDKYAVRAFHFSATHYLEKPVDPRLLREAIERVQKKRSENDLKLQLQVLAKAVRNLNSHPQQIILPNPKKGDSIVVPVKMSFVWKQAVRRPSFTSGGRERLKKRCTTLTSAHCKRKCCMEMTISS